MHPMLPDVALFVLAVLVVSVGFGRLRPWAPYHAAWIGLTLLLSVNAWRLLSGDPGGMLMGGSWKIDAEGFAWRALFIFCALGAVLLSRGYFLGKSLRTRLTQPGEFYGLLIVSALGGVTVVSATETLTLFIGLEMATIPLFFLSAWNKRDAESGEASVKYVVIGGISSAVMLFGLSYLYGFSGSLSIADLAQRVAAEPEHPLLWIGLLFVFASAGFKLTLFPFHMWAPDVYDGSSTPVAAFLSVGSKSVAVAFVALWVTGPLAPIRDMLSPMLLLLACATTLAGNLGALRQARLRRFMAWSGVSQAGFLVLALTGPAAMAKTSLLFFLLVYAFSNYLAFFIFSIVGASRDEHFTSLRGLSREKPALAVLLAVSMFSLAGIPPAAGFLGKFGLLASAASGRHWGALAWMVLNGVIGLYIYLTVLRSAWVDRLGEGENPAAILPSRRDWLLVWALGISVLLAGILPQLHERLSKITGFF